MKNLLKFFQIIKSISEFIIKHNIFSNKIRIFSVGVHIAICYTIWFTKNIYHL